MVAINYNTGLSLNDEILIQYFDKPNALTPKDLQGCRNSATAIFDLSAVYDEITEDPQNSGSCFNLNFYSSATNFANGIAIENPAAFEGCNQQEIIATITGKKSGCVSNVVEFNLNIASIPIVAFPEISDVCLGEGGSLLDLKQLGEDLGSTFTYIIRCSKY